MRKLCLLVILLTIALPAHAEITIDTETATIEELIEARTLIDAAIRARRTAENPSYSSGTYVVGQDIPEGTYTVYPSIAGSVSSVTVADTSNGVDRLLASQPVRVQLVAELNAGERVTLVHARAVPIESTGEVSLEGITNGGYLVGVHIPAGRYLLTPVPGAILPGYTIKASPSETAQFLSVGMLLREPVEVSLEDGSYLDLTDCSIARVN